jgi:uncharacterized Zn-binding protein involved in type VI secretion
MKKVARIGDQCSHGAIVITGDERKLTNNRKTARIGDLVSCPIPGHGVNPIVTSMETMLVTVDNRKEARITSISACGAVIIQGSDDVVGISEEE